MAGGVHFQTFGHGDVGKPLRAPAHPVPGVPRAPGRGPTQKGCPRMRLANILSLATAALLSVFLLSPAAAATGPVAKVLRQGPDGFSLRIEIPEVQQEIVDLPEGGSYLRVTLPGFGQGGTEDAGLPDLPRRGFPFGLPEDATAVLRFRVIDSQTFSGLAPIPVPTRRFVPGDPFPQEDDRYIPSPGAYASSALAPAEIAALGPTAGWRHQRVQSILVSPVQAAPATGEYRVARVIEVDVEFVRDSRAAKGIALVPAGPDAPGWDELIDGVLVNGSSAQSFRMRAAPATVASTITPGQSYVRVRFGSTGLARLSYAQIAAGGFPAAVPVAQVRVEERGYDKTKADPFTVVNLPRIVEDTNSNGVFDAGDFVVFYGFNYRDRYDNDLFYDERYSYFHTYWLTASAEGGRDYAEVDGYPAGDGYTLVTSFPQSDHYEEDLYYINNPPDNGGDFSPSGRPSTGSVPARPTSTPGSTPTTSTRKEPSASARSGRGSSRPRLRDHLVSLKINSCQLLTDGSFFSQDDFDYRSGSRPSAGCLSLGSNTVYITGRTSVITTSTGAGFDWFDLTYDRLFKARGNQLVFNSGDRTGLLEFAVTGFTSPDVVVVEITNPAAPVRMRAQVAEEGGTYTAKIRVSVGGTRRKFAAFVPASLNGLPATTRVLGADLGAQTIAAGLPRDLLAEGNGSDYILITHPLFKDAWGALVAHREAQGHRVFVCDVLEIYDQFAGGDKTPWAIQRFLAQAFRTWNPAPTYVLLGGDASEDYRATSVDENNRPTSDPDFVPTMMHFASVPGPEGKELAGTDNWFVAALRPTDKPLDVYPEMHIGRLPVGSVEEVNTVVDKIIAYEDWKPEDTWRNRAFIMADDQYSTSIYPGQNYCFKPDEVKFLNTSQAVLDSIRVLGRLPNFDCAVLSLAAYLDTVATLNRHPGSPSDCPLLAGLNAATSYTRSKVTPLMLQELSQGALTWEYHGHANKNQMATEALFQHYPKLTTRDFDKINNVGKPFIFFGYACHLNEFEHAKEKTFGDGMGEVLVLAGNRRGAIASIASTGYEWLHITPDAQRYTTRALFWNLPRDPATGRPRRILGEAMTRAWAACALENGDGADWREMFRTYVTLGDPALRVDIAGPGFQVNVNGETVTDGTPLVAASFSDTLRIDAAVSDDVDVSTIRVLDGETELPAERLTIVKPGSLDDGAQSYQVAFATTLRLGSYDISVVARDWTGRETRFVLPVSLDIAALADGKRLERDCSSVVDLAATIRFEVDSPVPLGEENFQVAADDTAVTAILAPVDETRRQWTVEVNRVWGAGQHDIVLRIQDEAGGEVSFGRCFTVSSGDTQLLSTYFYPNPCEGRDGALYYTLNQSVKRARLNVYAVSGRRVRRDDLPTSVGQNAFVWDLRDEAGDRVANGVYLFLLDLEGYDGRKIRRLERVAVTR